MNFKLCLLCLLTIVAVSGISSCYSMGKATGETKRAVKESVRDFKKGYHQGEKE